MEELGPRLVEIAQTEYRRVGLGAQGVSVLSGPRLGWCGGAALAARARRPRL